MLLYNHRKGAGRKTHRVDSPTGMKTDSRTLQGKADTKNAR